MAYISYKELCGSEFDNIVSKIDKLQDLNNNQLKLKEDDICKKKDEKLTTNFGPVNDEDVINEAYLDEKLKKIDGQLSLLGNDYNEFKLQNNKQSVEGILLRRAVKTTIRILCDEGMCDNYANADKV